MTIPDSPTIDSYGRAWSFPAAELCPTCGQPDNCGDCSHDPLTSEDAQRLRGEHGDS